MNPWHAILGFLSSGQRRRGVSVTLPGEEVVKSHRIDPPTRTAITLTRHETGISFDFPIRDPIRTIESDQAWRLFHIGLFLAIASVLGYVIIPISWTPGVMRHQVVYPFGIALILLAIAAHLSSKAIREGDAIDANDVHQLAVAGNLLVRKSRDQQKQIWYEHEIRDIVLTQSALTNAVDNSRGNLRLEICLQSGEIVNLITWNSVILNAEDGPREELQWVATQLRLALCPTLPNLADNAHADAIQAKDAPRDETRYTE